MSVDQFLSFSAWQYEDEAGQMVKEPSLTWDKAMEDLSSRLIRMTDLSDSDYWRLAPAALDAAS